MIFSDHHTFGNTTKPVYENNGYFFSSLCSNCRFWATEAYYKVLMLQQYSYYTQH